MVDVTSLVISIISLLSTILATGIGAWMTYFNEERKAHRETSKLLLKYRDPILSSAQDLQSRLYALCELHVLDFGEIKARDPGEERFRESLFIYTAYVVGQYLSWQWILRRQGQFTALMSNPDDKFKLPWSKQSAGTAKLMQKLDRITAAFNTDMHGEIESPFVLFKAYQYAIGEIMTTRDDLTGDLFCMGYASFAMKWRGTAASREGVSDGPRTAPGVATVPDAEFRRYFTTVDGGIKQIIEHRQRARMSGRDMDNLGSDGRLRRLQHLLLDLIHDMDPQRLSNNEFESRAVRAADDCTCERPKCIDKLRARDRRLSTRHALR